MTAGMTKATFVSTLRSDHQAWESALGDVPEERMTEPGAADEWSVKDLIAHVTVYERWTSEWVEAALKGEAPDWNYTEEEINLSLDERNARFYKKNQNRPLDEIRAEAAKEHTRLVAAVEAIAHDAVSKDIREFAPQVGAYYREGTTVWEAIDGNAAGHYREHTADVRKWLER